MTLQEAIRIETIHNDHNPDITDPERWEAHRLLIEASKLVESFRVGVPRHVIRLLPGETKE